MSRVEGGGKLSSSAYIHGPSARPGRKSAVHRIALFTVWLSVCLSGVVLEEPAPVDFLWILLSVALPLVGLVRTDRSLLLFLSAWLIICACGYLSAMNAEVFRTANVHISITLYLAIAAFTLGGVICADPEPHAKLIASAMIPAALITGITAVVGILSLVPGAYDIFTRWDRATGTFKDPNVMSAFLVPSIVILLDRLVNARLRAIIPYAVMLLILTFALVLSLSRGAFFNLVVSALVYFAIRFATFERVRQRLRATLILLTGVAVVGLILVSAFSLDKVGTLASSRLHLQTYDTDQTGRFAGQETALRVILDHPEGIGPLQFAPRFHLDSPHNVYLSLFLHSGWPGGMLFLLVNVATLMLGLRNSFLRTPLQGLFTAATGAFVGVFLEGFIIDTDHWRHLFVLYALIWGLSASPMYRQFRIQPYGMRLA